MVTFSSHLMKLRFELRFWLEELRLSFQRNCWYNFKISYLFIHFSCLNYEPWKWIYILYGDNRSIKNSLQQWIFRRSYSFYTTKHILLTPLLREISKVNLSIEVLEQNDIIIVFGSISLPTYISNFKTRKKEKYWT